MIFILDDGTAGQFNLVNENGTLKANIKSAVGIMEKFNRSTLTLTKGPSRNLSNGTFEEGTLGT